MQRKNLIISIYAILIAITTVTGYFLDHDNPIVNWDMLDVVLWLSFGVLLFFIVRFAINAFIVKVELCSADHTKVVDNLNYKKYWIFAFVIILTCYVIVWLAYYPGLWTYDLYQVMQVVNQTYDCWHPLIHTLLIGGCYVLGSKISSPTLGVAIYDWIQMLVMAGIFAYACIFVLKQVKRKGAYVISIIFYAVFPFNFIMAICSTKDVIFSGLVLLTVMFLWRYINEKPSKLVLITLFIITPLMLLFRNNASVAFCLFLLLALVAVRKKMINKRTLLLFLSFLIIYCGTNKVLKHVLDAKPVNIREMASVPSTIMGRIYSSGVADDEDMERISQYIDMNEANYDPYIADSMKGNIYDMDSKSDLADMMLYSAKLFVKYPRTSLDSILYLHEGAWYLGDKSHAELDGVRAGRGYIQTGRADGYGIVFDSKIPFLENLLERLFSFNEYQKNPIFTVIFSPAFYNWILLACVFTFFYQRKYKEAFASSFLVCLIVTVILGPCSIIRYFYPVMVSTPVIVSWTFRKSNSKTDAHELVSEA
ncbi:MAG: DUF6020 family protein [bacterium]|nr:DUF6020 family protein [bacterium]